MSSAAAVADTPRRMGPVPLLAVTAVLLLGFLAVLVPAAALGIPLAIGFVLIAFRSLAAGLAVFTLVISLEYVPGLEGDIGFIKVAGGVLVTAWAARLLLQRHETPLLLRDRPWVSAVLVGIVIWALASALWAADSSIAVSSALRLSQGIVLVFVVYSALRKPLHLRWLLGAYVVGALITVGFGLFSNASVDSGRLAGGVGDPNELAAFLLPAVTVCAFAILAGRSPLARWAYFTAGLLLLAAVFMTGSRGGLVALAVALATAIVMSGRERVKTVSAVLVIAGCGVAYFAAFAPPEQVDRLAAIRDDGGTGRSDIWAVAFETVRDRPVLGVGAGNFPVVEGRYATQAVDIGRIDLVLDESKVVHNTYLSFLSELGTVGFLAFAFVALAALSTGALAVRRLRPERWELQLVTRGFLIGLLGMLVAFAFFSAQYEKQLWLLLGVAFALPSCLPHRSDARAPNSSVLEEPTDYHRPMSEFDPESPLGEFPDRDEVVVSARHRLARREASLSAREQLVARREHELRHGTVNGWTGEAGASEAAAEVHARAAAAESRLNELEAELARRATALSASSKELEEMRKHLDESLRLRVADAERLAEAATFVLETEKRAEELHEKAELQKSRLRAKVRALQRRLKESEEVGAASLAEKLEARTQELDARERELAGRERRVTRREQKPPAEPT